MGASLRPKYITCGQRSVGSRGGRVLHDGFRLLVLTQQAAALVRKGLTGQVVAALPTQTPTFSQQI